MPRLIIKLANQQDQIFEIEKPEIIIGRGEESDLVLPNLSISREHAMIRLNEEGAEVVDLHSENGIRVNNDKVEAIQLKSKDEIFVGTFALIYLADNQEDKFYRGRAVIYLAKYDPKNANPTQDLTFKLSAKEAKNLLKEKSLLHHACVIDESKRRLYPESNPLTFGGKTAMVKVEGWFTSGVAAKIRWDNKRHILEKNKALASVNINGKKVSKQALNPGDTFQIGRTTFKYIVED